MSERILRRRSSDAKTGYSGPVYPSRRRRTGHAIERAENPLKFVREEAHSFPEVDSSDWGVFIREQRGTKPGKLWLIAPDKSVWLFKPRTMQNDPRGEFPKGDDWAEKLVAEIAAAAGIPAAAVDLTRRDGDVGILSHRISEGLELTLGNEILERLIPGYDADQRHGVEDYTIDAVAHAFSDLGVESPPGASGTATTMGMFASYLTLDALVANTDRHHENWGIIRDPEGSFPPRLAPSFDHASSLGFQLSDSKRLEIIAQEASLDAFCAAGRSRHFAGRPSLVDLACAAWARAEPRELDSCLDWLAGDLEETCEALVDRVPAERMSDPSRKLALAIMTRNRRRLLDELTN